MAGIRKRKWKRFDLSASEFFSYESSKSARSDEKIAEGKQVTYDLKPNRDDPTAVGTSQMADAIIKELYKQSGCKRKKVVTSISGHAVIVKKVTFAQMGEAELFELIHDEAEKYLADAKNKASELINEGKKNMQ